MSFPTNNFLMSLQHFFCNKKIFHLFPFLVKVVGQTVLFLKPVISETLNFYILHRQQSTIFISNNFELDTP